MPYQVRSATAGPVLALDHDGRAVRGKVPQVDAVVLTLSEDLQGQSEELREEIPADDFKVVGAEAPQVERIHLFSLPDGDRMSLR